MLGALAILMVACNDNLNVAITPDTPPPPPIVPYDTAEGIYFGDKIASGSAFFRLELFHSSDPDNRTVIMGFCTLPSGFADFKLDVGTYYMATTGNVRTLYPGMKEDDVEIGTYCYNRATGKMTWISSGSITVSQSGNEYTIFSYFDGNDAATGNAEENIRFSYTGSIDFVELPLAYDDIVNSTYVATGTPTRINNPGASTWTGTLEVVDNGSEKKYKIINWANRGNNYYVYCIYRDGIISIDIKTRVVYNDTYDGYFHVGFVDDDGLVTALINREYEVAYIKTTRMLDFSGTVTYAGRSYPAIVGIPALHNVTGEFGSTFSDFYSDLKIQLTPTKPTLRSTTILTSCQIAAIIKDIDFTQHSAKPAASSTPTVIVLDELDQTHVKMMSLQKLSEE